MGGSVMDIPPLPPGFTLDHGSTIPPLPAGFKLDQPAATSGASGSLMDDFRRALAHPSLGAALVGGPLETAAHLGTGMLATIGGGLAGLADIPLHAAGLTRTAPADVVHNVEQSGTYAPRT